MTYARSLSAFLLSLLGGVFAWIPPSHAQEVADLLNKAHEHYEQRLEEIERDAITRLDELIDQYSDEGNLKKVLDLRAQKMKLLEDRNWPESVLFRSMRAKIRSSRVRAKRELTDAYEDAIATLTKERRYDDAVALQEELEQLIEIQEEFDFRSEEPEQKKPEKDADDPKPEDKSPAKSPVKAKSAKPAPPQKRATSKASSKGLGAALAAEAARTPLVDPLATSVQKRDALTKLVETFYASLPPQKWTPSQFDEFVEFLGDAATKSEEGFILQQLGSSESPFGVIPGSWVDGDDIKGHPGMQWIVSSPTPDEFISRSTHLRKKAYWPAVDEAANADNLKVWFKTIGCKDAKSVAMLIDNFRQSGVDLSALDVIDKEVGSAVASSDNQVPASNKKASSKNAAGRKPSPNAGEAGSNSVAESVISDATPPEPSQTLAALINAGHEREVIANRLSTTQAKREALDGLLGRVSKHCLLADLTYADCKYLSWLIVVENRRLLDGVVWYPGTPKAVKGGLRWSASRLSGSIESRIPQVQHRFLALWIMGSKSPEEFVERVQFLNESGELEPSVPSLFSEDDLKVWLAAIGCDNEEKITNVLGKLRKANVEFPAVSKFAQNEGL